MIPSYSASDQEPEKADTVRGLAVKLGVDPEALQKTFNDFNTVCDENMEFNLMKLDGKATKGLSSSKSDLGNPIEKALFYGYQGLCTCP